MLLLGVESLVIYYLGRQACQALARCHKSSQRPAAPVSSEDVVRPPIGIHDTGAEKAFKRASTAAKADIPRHPCTCSPQQAASSTIRAIWCPPPSHHHTAVQQQPNEDSISSGSSSSDAGSSEYLLPELLVSAVPSRHHCHVLTTTNHCRMPMEP